MLAVVSGVVLAIVLLRTGWALVALPPLVLLVGLVQLSYCDLTRRLLPKTLVRALGVAVLASGVLAATVTNEPRRLVVAAVGAAVLFAVCFGINLINPAWLGFGDVRLSAVVGFGLAWVSPMAVLECFCLANLLAAAVGFALICAHRADRQSGMPFGFYLTVGTALVLMAWSP
jgi:leader peptidase (prepilin peptidase)/N-methyltransferase